MADALEQSDEGFVPPIFELKFIPGWDQTGYAFDIYFLTLRLNNNAFPNPDIKAPSPTRWH